jgi:hypothetical protein
MGEYYLMSLWTIIFAADGSLDIWLIGGRMDAIILQGEHLSAYLLTTISHTNHLLDKHMKC